MQAFAPHCPVPREERWYVILADAANNVTLTWVIVSLMEAEAAGVELARHAPVTAGQGKEAESQPQGGPLPFLLMQRGQNRPTLVSAMGTGEEGTCKHIRLQMVSLHVSQRLTPCMVLLVWASVALHIGGHWVEVTSFSIWVIKLSPAQTVLRACGCVAYQREQEQTERLHHLSPGCTSQE